MHLHFDNVWFMLDLNDNTKNANMKNNKLTSNPTVYGIISQSPLFKVAFPDALIVDSKGEDDAGSTMVIDDSYNATLTDLPKA